MYKLLFISPCKLLERYPAKFFEGYTVDAFLLVAAVENLLLDLSNALIYNVLPSIDLFVSADGGLRGAFMPGERLCPYSHRWSLSRWDSTL